MGSSTRRERPTWRWSVWRRPSPWLYSLLLGGAGPGPQSLGYVEAVVVSSAPASSSADGATRNGTVSVPSITPAQEQAETVLHSRCRKVEQRKVAPTSTAWQPSLRALTTTEKDILECCQGTAAVADARAAAAGPSCAGEQSEKILRKRRTSTAPCRLSGCAPTVPAAASSSKASWPAQEASHKPSCWEPRRPDEDIAKEDVVQRGGSRRERPAAVAAIRKLEESAEPQPTAKPRRIWRSGKATSVLNAVSASDDHDAVAAATAGVLDQSSISASSAARPSHEEEIASLPSKEASSEDSATTRQPLLQDEGEQFVEEEQEVAARHDERISFRAPPAASSSPPSSDFKPEAKPSSSESTASMRIAVKAKVKPKPKKAPASTDDVAAAATSTLTRISAKTTRKDSCRAASAAPVRSEAVPLCPPGPDLRWSRHRAGSMDMRRVRILQRPAAERPEAKRQVIVKSDTAPVGGHGSTSPDPDDTALLLGPMSAGAAARSGIDSQPVLHDSHPYPRCSARTSRSAGSALPAGSREDPAINPAEHNARHSVLERHSPACSTTATAYYNRPGSSSSSAVLAPSSPAPGCTDTDGGRGGAPPAHLPQPLCMFEERSTSAPSDGQATSADVSNGWEAQRGFAYAARPPPPPGLEPVDWNNQGGASGMLSEEVAMGSWDWQKRIISLPNAWASPSGPLAQPQAQPGAQAFFPVGQAVSSTGNPTAATAIDIMRNGMRNEDVPQDQELVPQYPPVLANHELDLYPRYVVVESPEPTFHSSGSAAAPIGAARVPYPYVCAPDQAHLQLACGACSFDLSQHQHQQQHGGAADDFSHAQWLAFEPRYVQSQHVDEHDGGARPSTFGGGGGTIAMQESRCSDSRTDTAGAADHDLSLFYTSPRKALAESDFSGSERQPNPKETAAAAAQMPFLAFPIENTEQPQERLSESTPTMALQRHRDGDSSSDAPPASRAAGPPRPLRRNKKQSRPPPPPALETLTPSTEGKEVEVVVDHLDPPCSRAPSPALQQFVETPGGASSCGSHTSASASTQAPPSCENTPHFLPVLQEPAQMDCSNFSLVGSSRPAGGPPCSDSEAEGASSSALLDDGLRAPEDGDGLGDEGASSTLLRTRMNRMNLSDSGGTEIDPVLRFVLRDGSRAGVGGGEGTPSTILHTLAEQRASRMAEPGDDPVLKHWEESMKARDEEEAEKNEADEDLWEEKNAAVLRLWEESKRERQEKKATAGGRPGQARDDRRGFGRLFGFS